MALLKYVCTATHFDGSKLWQKGNVKLSPVSPGVDWALYPADDELTSLNARVDRDGTYFYGAIGYEDFRMPLTLSKTGSNLKPDFDYTNNGYLFPQNDTSEVLYISDQFLHSMYMGSGAVGHPHLHIIQSANQPCVFKAKFRAFCVGEAVPEWTQLTSTGYAIPYTSGSISQIVIFPEISLAGLGLSCIVDAQIWRDDNTYTGDILVKSLDIHIPIDSLGSGQEYFK